MIQSVNYELIALKLVLVLGVIVIGLAAQAPQTQPAPPEQPLPFSHKLHVAQGLKCTGCHVNPEPGEQMTFPATAKCMSCHNDVAVEKPAIKKLAEYHQKKEAVPWVRIYKNPDWVWFSHRTHLAKEAKCERCHGAVAEREVMFKEKPTTMESCMNCHRETNVSNACNFCHEGH